MQLSAESQRIRQLIKRLMKRNGYQYADLAKVLGVSTPTVKRIMTRDEMSLERLIAIASWLKIPLHELITLANEGARGNSSFTDEQEEHLAARPLEWLYFHWILTGHEGEELARRLRLPRPQVRRIVSNLTRLGLVDTSGAAPRITTPGPYQMKPDGPLERAYYAKVLHSVLRRIARHVDGYRDAATPEDLTLVRPFEMVLRRETYHEMVRELRDAVSKYRLRSRLEMAVDSQDKLLHISGVMAADVYYPWTDALGIKQPSG
jgi:transcriptional regulator with XRE-family HTH domain